jgi:glycine dehydrogenase subunit 2
VAESGIARSVGDRTRLVRKGCARPARAAELSEPEVLRHYLHLSQETLGA